MSVSRGILLASSALAAVAALLLWWALRSDPKLALPESVSGTNEPAVAAHEPYAPDPVADPGRTTALDPTAVEGVTDAPEPLWIDLRLVDAATSLPVADAEVFWNDAAADRHVQQLPTAEAQLLERDPEQKARRFGRRARSDRDGWLRIAMEPAAGYVYARAGELYGERCFSPFQAARPDGYSLVMARDESLTVRVLDASGQPAVSIPVCVGVRLGHVGAPEGQYQRRLQTDAAGLVRFAHVQQLRPRRAGGTAVAAWVVRVEGTLGPVVEPTLIDATKPLPEEGVQIQLPPTGSLRLRFLLAGRPCPGVRAALVNAGPLGGDERGERLAELAVELGRPTGDLTWSAEQCTRQPADADGWVTVPWLPLGVPLFARPLGQSGSLKGWSDWSELPPLVEPGERPCEVDLTREAIVLRGRLLDAAGAPLAGQEFGIEFETNRGEGEGRIATDAEGTFLLLLGHAGELTKLLRCDVLLPADSLSLAERALQVGVNDLGDLRCRAHPLLVAGRIDGDPVAPGTVRLVIQRADDSLGERAPNWRSLRGAPVAVGEDGRFEVRTRSEPGRHRLLAHAVGMLELAPIEFSVGVTDLVVPLRTAYSFEVAGRLPEGTSDSPLLVELVGGSPSPVGGRDVGATGEPAPTGLRGITALGAGGRFQSFWSGVDRGTYSLVVSVPGFAKPLLVLPDVVVPAEKEGDPRLRSIDLRPLLQLVTLRVVDPDGKDAAGHGPFAYVVGEPELTEAKSAFLLGARQARWWVPRGVSSAWVVARGFRPQRVALGASSPIDVRLERWLRVGLRLAPGTVLPTGCELLVRCGAERMPGGRSVEVVSPGLECQSLELWSRTFVRLEDLLHPGRGVVVLRHDGEWKLLEIDPWVPELHLRLDGRTRPLLRAIFGDWPEARTGRGVTITLDHDELAAAAKALAGKEAPK